MPGVPGKLAGHSPFVSSATSAVSANTCSSGFDAEADSSSAWHGDDHEWIIGRLLIQKLGMQ